MQNRNARQLLLTNPKESLVTPVPVALNKRKLVQILEESVAETDLGSTKGRIRSLKSTIIHGNNGERIPSIGSDGDIVAFRKDVLISELDQILRARTVQRTQYYIKRLRAGVEEARTSRVNDINLRRWKEYDEIVTDSLWVFDRRDTSGAHLGWYWGNFIPQIPRQMLLRYTKRGEWVLDPFAGSGTTLIECRRLGRNGIGIELNEKVSIEARALIEKEANRFDVVSDVIVGDSTKIDFTGILEERGIDQVQLLIMHPPYHDIIQFSQDPRDLSNAPTVERFLEMFGEVVERTYPILGEGRYLAVVIGDKYSKGEWIPLGFYVMNEVLKAGYKLKSIIVKNFDETRAKRDQKGLWRYRALVGGFYVFKHEYILLFQKE